MHHLASLHPTAQVIFMDDDECLQLMQSTRELVSEVAMRWYRGDASTIARLKQSMPTTSPYYHGKYKSDFCRLVQLYHHGGIYFDTDLQVARNVQELLTSTNASFASVLSHSDADWRNDVFQALLASKANTSLVARAISYFDQWLRAERSIYGLAGPSLLGQAIQDEMGIGYMNDASIDALRERGVFLMKEAHPTHKTVRWHMDQMGPQACAGVSIRFLFYAGKTFRRYTNRTYLACH